MNENQLISRFCKATFIKLIIIPYETISNLCTKCCLKLCHTSITFEKLWVSLGNIRAICNPFFAKLKPPWNTLWTIPLGNDSCILVL